jgi:hypothetical protein
VIAEELSEVVQRPPARPGEDVQQARHPFGPIMVASRRPGRTLQCGRRPLAPDHGAELGLVPLVVGVPTVNGSIAVHRGIEHQTIVIDDGCIKLAGGKPFTSLSGAGMI